MRSAGSSVWLPARCRVSTLLPGVLEAARYTLMLAAGPDKAEPLHAVLCEPYNPKKYPAQIATYNGQNVTWFVDKAAARLVE